MFNTICDFLIYLIFRFLMLLFYILPRKWVVKFLTFFGKTVLKYHKLYRKVTLINLGFAYPDKSIEWRLEFIDEIASELARAFYDIIRIPFLSKEWIKKHVEFEDKEKLNKKYSKKTPIIFVTGHLGSFELLIYSCSLLKGNHISIVVKSLKNKFIDKYWNSIRSKYGSRIIKKDGAYKASLKAIKNNHDIGFPFDQNMKRYDSVFVDFFGKKAATSKTLAVLALRHRVPVVFAYIKHIGNDKYTIRTRECFYKDICDDKSLNHEEKIEVFTTRAMGVLEELIRECPAGWFWMHRRWKTRPEGEEQFY
ncbi:MAG: lysophospholipid acyltransferase family protein [Bdellovibrionota bacterium]